MLKTKPCEGLPSKEIISPSLRIVEAQKTICDNCYWRLADTCRECKAQEAADIIKRGTMYHEKFIPWRGNGK